MPFNTIDLIRALSSKNKKIVIAVGIAKLKRLFNPDLTWKYTCMKQKYSIIQGAQNHEQRWSYLPKKVLMWM